MDPNVNLLILHLRSSLGPPVNHLIILMKTSSLLLLALIYLCASACSKEKAPSETTTESTTSTTNQSNLPKHQLYHQWHNQCLSGDKATIDRQITKFQEVLAKQADDHLARAYLGSAYALRAKVSFWGPTKLNYLNRGKEALNTAVKAAPKDLRVRMVRAIGYYKVPKKFKTRATSVSDFEFLMKQVTLKSCPLQINEKQAILYYAYLTFTEEHHRNAAEAKKRCHQLAPDSKYGKLTR